MGSALRVALPVLAGLSLSIAFSAIRQTAAGDPRVEQAVELARLDASRLGGRIRNLLAAELARGGFPGAARACSRLAQKATAEFQAETGRPIRRVSLRFRNPSDAPDAYETRKLTELEIRHKERNLPAESYEVVSENDRRFVRYLKPIVIQPMCLSCHGEPSSVPAAVRSVLKTAYPKDRAMGYQAGDLRGAFSVRVPLAR